MILDSSAIIAILEQESDAHVYARRIAEASIVKIPAPTYLEVSMVLSRHKNADALKKFNEFILEMQIEIMPFGPEEAYAAVQGHGQYGKGQGGKAQLNFGDCISYAASKSTSMPLLFKGDDFRHTDVESAL